MKVRTAIIMLVLAGAMGYTLALTGHAVVFLAFCFAATVLVLVVVSLLLSELLWKVVPVGTRERHPDRKAVFKGGVLVCFLFLYFGGWAVNFYWLPAVLHPVSIGANAGMLLLCVCLGWSLISRSGRSVLVTCGLAVSLFVYVLLVRAVVENDADSQESALEKIKALPYLGYVVEEKAGERDGVVRYEQGACGNGINLYNSSMYVPGAYLMDMSGKILHRWTPPSPDQGDWLYVKMTGDGDLLVIIRDVMLMRLDWDSKVKWMTKMRAHHDIALAENGDIYTLSRKDEVVFWHGMPFPILNDYVVVLSPDGEVKKEISFYKALKEVVGSETVVRSYLWILHPETMVSVFRHLIQHGFLFDHDSLPDVFHVNTIERLNSDLGGEWEKGRVLFCSKMQDQIGLIDPEEERATWMWGKGVLDKPHQPTVLENGNILVFDNGNQRGHTRILEVDRLTYRIVWRYVARPPDSFFTSWGGSNQRLPNGNTLITESSQGRVFEVTRGGEIVWEFYNPDRSPEGKRATIYRFARLTDPERYPRLKELP